MGSGLIRLMRISNHNSFQIHFFNICWYTSGVRSVLIYKRFSPGGIHYAHNNNRVEKFIKGFVELL